ncbi:MAG: hypothetical protein R3D33_14660 [Hyphomicrobiaceae bacterium]
MSAPALPRPSLARRLGIALLGLVAALAVISALYLVKSALGIDLFPGRSFLHPIFFSR